MEGFVGRRGLIEAKRLRALSRRSNLKGTSKNPCRLS